MKIEPYHPFRSIKAKNQYSSIYELRANEWPVVSETSMIKTSFGQTFVRISGDPKGKPLVLLPGANAHSLMWVLCIKKLSANYKTIAVDAIYDLGLSIYERRLNTIDDCILWLDELLTSLELDNHIRLLGHSFGGAVIFQYALRFAERLSKIITLAPAGTILPFKISLILKSLPGMIHPFFMRIFLCWMFKDSLQKNETTRKLTKDGISDMLTGIKCFKPRKQIIPRMLTDNELKYFRVPSLCIFGENEVICSPFKAVERINYLSQKIKTKIIPKAGHDLFIAQSEMVTNEAISFLKEN